VAGYGEAEVKAELQERGSLELLGDLERTGAISTIGLHIADPNLSYERAEAIGSLLGTMYESVRFAIGDWLLLCEKLFPERFSQIAEALPLSEGGRLEFMRVSGRVPRSTRRKGLSWSHHRAVAALAPPEQKAWLRKAATEGMSHAALRDALRPVADDSEREVCPTCGRVL